MAKKFEDMKLEFGRLSDERAKLDGAIEEMIVDMAEVPAEQRTTGAWSPTGASTQRYLALTARQAELETEIIDLARAIAAASDKPSASLH